ncbi:MAG: 3-methyl-2-oxobutanoate hydroxymethyltransferase [Actinomycetota bacterium]
MKIRTGTLAKLKSEGKKFSALTSYDALSAQIFDEAGIEVLLVGDSAGNVVLGHDTTVPVTLEEMIPFGRAVISATKSALVVVDLPFGTYEISDAQAMESSIKVMKQTGADAVKLEGPRYSQVKALVSAGIPVMGHVGFTPQSVNQLSGFKVQGRGEAGEQILQECLGLQEAGAFAIVLEMVPAKVAAAITEQLRVPTIGIGAGSDCDGQILVWTDMAGLGDRSPSFAKKYAELRTILSSAAAQYRHEVALGIFPEAERDFS